MSVRGFFADRLAREQPIFERAVARGQLAADTDLMTIVDLIAGAIWLRAVFRGLPADSAFVSDIVRTRRKPMAGPTPSGSMIDAPSGSS